MTTLEIRNKDGNWVQPDVEQHNEICEAIAKDRQARYMLQQGEVVHIIKRRPVLPYNHENSEARAEQFAVRYKD